ncbi:uncharacterized protein LOC129743456 [Uranotaenia lowii]|uniref:uncharacterized protein LOC129743456 n=1 Tax=Uranotaenia lowii TaxID=190385 RepID=UPI0024792B17|nr:uncharacterized protein LOC129743456 [Uranotaenia lowii]
MPVLLTAVRLIFKASPDRTTYLYPVHRKGDWKDINNYRGVCGVALCAISKLFELIVMDPIFSYCKQKFSIDKHGFIPKHSTITNLLTFTYVRESFAAKSQTDAIYIDLSAAFDIVNHDIEALLGKTPALSSSISNNINTNSSNNNRISLLTDSDRKAE